MIVGIAMAAPIGPMGLLIVSRTLSRGISFGIVSGLGVALADTTYACLAGFGFTAVTTFMAAHSSVVRPVGSVILGAIGIKYMLSGMPVRKVHDQRTKKFLKGFWSIFMLTLVNPMTIMFFLAVFSSLGLTGAHGSRSFTFTFICGVFFGSTLWWLILSAGTNSIGRQIKPRTMMIINRVSGVLLIGFALFDLLR